MLSSGNSKSWAADWSASRKPQRSTMTSFPETTHAVQNQAEPRVNVNEYKANAALIDAVTAYAPEADVHVRDEIGAHGGTEECQHAAEAAKTKTPEMHTHARRGHRHGTGEDPPAPD